MRYTCGILIFEDLKFCCKSTIYSWIYLWSTKWCDFYGWIICRIIEPSSLACALAEWFEQRYEADYLWSRINHQTPTITYFHLNNKEIEIHQNFNAYLIWRLIMPIGPELNARKSAYHVHSGTTVQRWHPPPFLSVWYKRKYCARWT